MTDPSAIDVDEFLDQIGFDAEENVLTRRQAAVLALRAVGTAQADIADRLGTSRANVSNIEASARENVSKARAAVEFADVIDAPVQVPVAAETDLYDVPERIFGACDDAEITVSYTEPELVSLISEQAGDAVVGRAVNQQLLVSVTNDGTVRVQRGSPD
jgi:hypothetical protein